MVKRMQKVARTKAGHKTVPRMSPEAMNKEERILRAATIYLMRKVAGLLVATGLREEQKEGSRRWIITVTLRYPTGHEGYVGDLLFDGKGFSFITPLEVRKERIKKIAADPAGIRQWNEHRASTLRRGSHAENRLPKLRRARALRGGGVPLVQRG